MTAQHCEECGELVVQGQRADGFDPTTGEIRTETFYACPTALEYGASLPREHYPSIDGDGPAGQHHLYFPRFWEPRPRPEVRPSRDRKGWRWPFSRPEGGR